MAMAAQLQEDTISRMQQVQAEMQALEGNGGADLGAGLDDTYLFGGMGAPEPSPAARAPAAHAAPAMSSMIDDGIGHVSEPSSSSDSDDSDDGDVGGAGASAGGGFL
jgi:hypothetical protein